jgi:dephospho-CoA kinase
MIIGLTGPKAAGKGIIAEILQEKGFNYISLSDIVRDEASKRGIFQYDTFQLQDIAKDLRTRYGNAVLAQRAIEKMTDNDYVLDSIRNVSEIEELRKLPSFSLISIDAPQMQRYERLIKRARPSDPKSWDDFIRMEEIDLGQNEFGSGQQVYACMQKSDLKIYVESMSGIRETIKPILEKYLYTNHSP